MPVDRVEQEVLREAETAAAKMIEEARRSQEKILAGWRADCEEAYRQAVGAAVAAAARETARQASGARHRGRLAALEAKNDRLNEVFRLAREALLALPDTEYMRMMESRLLAVPEDAGGALRVGKRDAGRFSEDFLRGVNGRRSGRGQFGGVVVDAEIDGGFVIDGEDFRIDQTIGRTMAQLREAMAGELAEELFGGAA